MPRRWSQDTAAMLSRVRGMTASFSPRIFLPWFRSQLEHSGARFERISKVAVLGDREYHGHDVLVDVSGSESLVFDRRVR